jgi:hypothetical protein
MKIRPVNFGAILRSTRTRCATCDSALARPGYVQCRRCYTGARPTPVRLYCESHRVSLRDLAERAGVSRPTIMRAAAGHPLSLRVARRIRAVTGIELAKLVIGEAEASSGGAS